MAQQQRSGLVGVAEAAEQAGPRGLPPVHLWHPERCGEIDILIRRDGTWLHEGAPIARPALARLFSTVLRKDPDGFYLVTPVEMLKIRVEDAPFTAVRVDQVGDVLRFTTNMGDVVDAGPDNPIRVEVDPGTGEPAPYVHVRRGLEARLLRPVFYEIAAMAEQRDGPGGPQVGVSSGTAFFPIAAEGVALS